MLSRNLIRPLGIAVGTGTALTGFGLAVPAAATVDCSSGITVDATEAAIRDAISANWGLICVRPGTIDMSSSGIDGNSSPIEFNDQSLRLVALGTVVFDGGGEAPNALLSYGSASEDLEIDGFTFQDFSNSSSNPYGIVNLDGTTGTLTVLNSTFTGNAGYAMVTTSDATDGLNYPSIVIDKSVFEDDLTFFGAVWGKSDITVSDSTFLNIDGTNAIDKWSDSDVPDSLVILHGNYFEGNTPGSDSTVWIDAPQSTIYNNTFVNNYSTASDYGSAIGYADSSSGNLAFNTFVNNDSDYDQANVTIGSNTQLTVQGNLFKTIDGEKALDIYDIPVNDRGGNVSTGDDSDVFPSTTSLSSVTESQLALSDAADNGGYTWTVKIGENSVAQDRLTSAVVANEQGPDLAVDQRGSTRGALVDAGAYDDGEAHLAATGVDASGIALTGGVIGAAGVALAARRRRNRV